jgi:hypothetical protein
MVDYEYYSSSASKGFSYLVPYIVQTTLTKLLKKLPSSARPLYREYYGDIMASRARAQDSADAMVVFVDESFPHISKDHNRLANLMNAEMNKQQDGVLVKIPMTGDGTAAIGNEDGEPVVRPRKRKQSVAKPKSAKSAKSAKSSKKVTSSEAASKPVVESTMCEESPESAFPPTVANTELVAPALPSRSATPSASHSDNDNEQLDVSEDNTEMGMEPLDPPEPWDDSLWPHGAWIDGLEVIDALPWAHSKSA